MLIYTLIMVGISIPFVWLGIRINRGDLFLIHDYHRKHVKEEEKAAYAREFSRGMFGMAASMTASGVAALLGESGGFMAASLVVLFLGFAVCVAVFLRVQKKYNGGFL